MSEPEDFVVCRVCCKEYGQLTGQHLRNHGLTLGQYKEMFPDASTVAERVRRMLSAGVREREFVCQWCNRVFHVRMTEARYNSGVHPTYCSAKCRCRGHSLEMVWVHSNRMPGVSKCEKILHGILDELGVKWNKRFLSSLAVVSCYRVFDAVVEEYKGVKLEIALEADGCYWHGCEEHCLETRTYSIIEKSIKKDIRVNSLCQMLNISLYRFWEHDLLNNLGWVEEQMQGILDVELEKIAKAVS